MRRRVGVREISDRVDHMIFELFRKYEAHE